MGSALAGGGSISEPAGIGSVRHRGSFWQLLTEATPAAPPLPKPCHTDPIQYNVESVVTVQNGTFFVYVFNPLWYLTPL